MTFWVDRDLHQKMEQESRRLLAARMLPIDGPLTADQRADVVRAVNEHIAKYDIKQKSLAKQCPEIGGDGNVSAILAGSYDHPTKIDEHIRTLNDWLEIDARRRRMRPQRKYVETIVARRLKNCADEAVKRRMIAVAYGPTGIGKSMVSLVVSEKYPGSVYIRVTRENRGWRDFRTALAKEARVTRRKSKKAGRGYVAIGTLLVEELKDSNRLIIIDEAHNLPDLTLEFVRDVFDECKVPVLMVSTIDLAQRIKDSIDENHGQLYRRVGWFCDLTHGRDKVPGGRKPLFTIADIRGLYESDKVRLADDAAKYLQDCANHLGRGSLGLCDNLHEWAILVERTARKLSPEATVTIRAESLRVAELQSREDELSRDEMRMRGVSVDEPDIKIA